MMWRRLRLGVGVVANPRPGKVLSRSHEWKSVGDGEKGSRKRKERSEEWWKLDETLARPFRR